jgi:hypothetical protein
VGWGAGSEQQSAAACWIDVGVLTLLIVGMQYTLYEIMGLNPIKQGAQSEVVHGEMVTKTWFIFGRFAFTELVVKIGRGGLKRLFDLFNDAL